MPDIGWVALATGILGYLLGSVPFGLLLTMLAGLGDIRRIGSGNIGATNVLRTGRKSVAAATLILDGGKGALAVFLTQMATGSAPVGLIAGFAAVLGHNFPVWLAFKGGKGVATTIGTLLIVAWPVGFGICLVWLVVALVSRYSSLAALVSLGLSPLMAWLVGYPEALPLTAALAILAFLRHVSNIRRILKGEESRIDFQRIFRFRS